MLRKISLLHFSCFLGKSDFLHSAHRLITLGSSSNRFCHQVRHHFASRKNMAESIQITSPVFRGLFTPELETLAALFKESGYEIRMAGGAVRDILMNVSPVDVDFATTATPIEMKKMFTEKEIRMLKDNGEKHGTITARINDKENFEITTLRIDKSTDGRWAEVEFTTDWALDANRRDLTINSMFLDLDGKLYDYFDGMNDLLQRKIRFVGDANKRIQEDYLRILRYFRFYGRISPKADDHDQETLNAIRDNADGLARISGERIWSELRKIITGNYADSLIQKMIDLGLTKHMGLPFKPDMDELTRVWKHSKDCQPRPITLLTALVKNEDDVNVLDARIKLSNEECGIAFFLLKHRDDSEMLEYCKKHPEGDPITPYKHLLIEELQTIHIREARLRVEELLKYRGDSVLLKTLSEWEIPKFPVTGTMMVEMGLKGKQVGFAINRMRHLWIKSDFTKSIEELLQKDLPGLMKEFPAHAADVRDSGKRRKLSR